MVKKNKKKNTVYTIDKYSNSIKKCHLKYVWLSGQRSFYAFVLHLGKLNNLHPDASTLNSELSRCWGSARIWSTFLRVQTLSRVWRSHRFRLKILWHSFTTLWTYVLFKQLHFMEVNIALFALSVYLHCWNGMRPDTVSMSLWILKFKIIHLYFYNLAKSEYVLWLFIA